MKIQLSRQV